MDRSRTTATKKRELPVKLIYVLALIGALNWGLVGFFNFNLVDAILGGGAREVTSGLSRIIYALVGLAGIIGLAVLPRVRYRTRSEATV